MSWYRIFFGEVDNIEIVGFLIQASGLSEISLGKSSGHSKASLGKILEQMITEDIGDGTFFSALYAIVII